MAYHPENYLSYDLIIECPCCNDFRFEEDSKVHCKEPPSSSQTPTKPYIYTTEISVEHTIYALSEGRKASWNTSLYLQHRYEVKHPERNAFKPPPEESTEVKNGYRKWAHYVRCNYEVKDNLLYKKYRAKPSKSIAQGAQQSIIRRLQCVVVDSQTEAVDPIYLSSENEQNE